MLLLLLGVLGVAAQGSTCDCSSLQQVTSRLLVFVKQQNRFQEVARLKTEKDTLAKELDMYKGVNLDQVVMSLGFILISVESADGIRRRSTP